jgi:hypothetical protein
MQRRIYERCKQTYFAHHEMEWAFLAKQGSWDFTGKDRDEVKAVLDERWSEPKDEWHDRQRLYEVYFSLVESIENYAIFRSA